MNSRLVLLAAASVVIAAAAIWALRSSDEIASARQAESSRRETLAHPSPTSPAPTAASPAATKSSAHPASGSASSSLVPQAKGPVPHENELIARLFRAPGPGAPEVERLAWAQSPLSDLFYPSDHPCAGRPRDSVSPDVLIGAAEEQLDALVLPASNPASPDTPPPLDLDATQCHLKGNWSVYPLNNECGRGLNRDSPESVARFMACVEALPQNPTAYYLKNIWLPCPADHPKATTMREFFHGLVADQVNQLFAGPPCSAN